MPELTASKTFENLKSSFAGESQSNRRYLYFARQADIEGHTEVAAIFRDTAEGETGHAFGLIDYLENLDDPLTTKQKKETKENLVAAIIGETHEFADLYPGFARTAREEGFEEIAEWFETLSKSEKSHAARLSKALEIL
jgi:rubrerythrin